MRFNLKKQMEHQELENKFMRWFPKWYKIWLASIFAIFIVAVILSNFYEYNPDFLTIFVGGFSLGTLIDHYFVQKVWIGHYKEDNEEKKNE